MPYIIVDDSEEWKQRGWKWGGPERIEFDIANPRKFDTTSQFWGRNYGWIRFKVRVRSRNIDGEITKVHIKYREDDNKHLYEKHNLSKGDIIYGEHILTIKKDASSGPSVWKNKEGEWPGPGWQLETISGGRHNRRRTTVHAIQRGEQGAFRQQLLSMDECCALTGEACEVVLEAAHVFPASKGGREVLSNGMLLRADIHRLYDHSLDGKLSPKFAICPETGMVRVADDFYYASFDLHGAQVDESVRERISDALNLRHEHM